MVSSPSPPLPTAASEPKQQQQRGGTKAAPEKADKKYAQVPTPLHHGHGGASKKTPRGAKGSGDAAADPAAYVAAVSCSDCRFKQRALAPASPGAVIRSLFVSLTRRSTPRSSPSATSASPAGDVEQWRLAAADLSRRLAAATRTRDEALEETTRLKHSLAELELKLARLESRVLPTPAAAAAFPVDSFLHAVSTARAAVRNLASALSTHLRSPSSPGPSLQSFLNRAFHADFELDTDADVHTPDPAGRCQANLAAYHAIAVLTWEEVLLHGTKHYSDGLSRFCDAKMSEVVSSLGWARARAWPEPLLQAFFLAAKGVWGVRLLARSVHPPLPVVRAERGARFDPRFMEDAATSRAGRLEPASVKMMVAPGFHVYLAGAGVVKCRVVCFYSSSNGRTGGHRDGGSSANGSVGLGSSCSDMNGSATDVVGSCKSSRVGLLHR
ncbi:IRK-interacting protein-like [Miscanthus floridulus]|uniref:IRK-interacting protein-like n=1 Tax=Miscanthus floridulus TaxID=154761 RepID=UPI00345793AE